MKDISRSVPTSGKPITKLMYFGRDSNAPVQVHFWSRTAQLSNVKREPQSKDLESSELAFDFHVSPPNSFLLALIIPSTRARTSILRSSQPDSQAGEFIKNLSYSPSLRQTDERIIKTIAGNNVVSHVAHLSSFPPFCCSPMCVDFVSSALYIYIAGHSLFVCSLLNQCTYGLFESGIYLTHIALSLPLTFSLLTQSVVSSTSLSLLSSFSFS